MQGLVFGEGKKGCAAYLDTTKKFKKNQGKLSLVWNCENGLVPWARDCEERKRWKDLWNFFLTVEKLQKCKNTRLLKCFES